MKFKELLYDSYGHICFSSVSLAALNFILLIEHLFYLNNFYQLQSLVRWMNLDVPAVEPDTEIE